MEFKMNAKTEILKTTASPLKTWDLRSIHQMCLPDLLRHQAQNKPDATAVVGENGSLSYKSLVCQSQHVGHHLRALGALPDDCVGVFADPSLELMVGIWGILFSRSAYLPLSPEYPEERLRYMIEDSRIKLIFCQRELKDKLTALVGDSAQIVTLEDIDLSGEPKPYDPTKLSPRNLAYIIYTSGSTGRPKGVMIEHRAIVNQLNWLEQQYRFDGQTVILQKTPMSFDAAQWEILAPVFGAKVVMGQPGIYRDPEAIIDTITRYGVTTFQCVPTLLQAMLDLPACQDCKTLKQIYSGGEILTSQLSKECFDVLPWVSLVNLYGPTECTINASAHVVERAAVQKGSAAIAIGKPVGNTRFYILDEALQPVNFGKMGELYVGGAQLARGYLHRAEMTFERFVVPRFDGCEDQRLYKTGDLAYQDSDGNYHFSGRVDNQVKLRGFRVELDEIRLAIEDHSWVKSAAVIIKNDARNNFQNLIGCIELNPKEAALMDQGNHGSHHQSKRSKLQVKAQLANPGIRADEQLQGRKIIALDCKEPTAEQSALVFARKSYRFFEGGDIAKADIVELLDHQFDYTDSIAIADLTMPELGEMLRYFGRFVSEERLLAKYGYASPGALYATQMYFELHGICELAAGIYYYHPVEHQLVLITPLLPKDSAMMKIHFLGKRRAIEPVYKNNILEVLEIETGHMLGLFDYVLPQFGLGIGQGQFTPDIKDSLEGYEEDFYLGSFAVVSAEQANWQQNLDVYVQTHAGKVVGLPMAKYRYQDGEFSRISGQLIQKKHVIAINQKVYERSSFGISIVSRDSRPWVQYIDLGRKLQHLQMNDVNIGLMSSGYSSKTGNDLPSAVHMGNILKQVGSQMSAFYFCIGGRVSDEQLGHRGMKEDTIHMKGPTEMLKDDLAEQLPNYMVPNKIIVLDKLPQTANGKVDYKALAHLPELNDLSLNRPLIAPRNAVEMALTEIFKATMKLEAVSVQDDFFECGGNSLMAVAMVNKINREFESKLPLQVLFEAPTVEKLARCLDEDYNRPISRMVPLNEVGENAPVFCWPGLGGYPMNLRLLGMRTCLDRPFYGVQAFGINQDERPFATISEMAKADIEQIKRVQPTGPYHLWGYSFGARVAFETAWQLESAGDKVEQLCLIAPGSPELHQQIEARHGDSPTFDNPGFVTILYSVFGRKIEGAGLEECLAVSKDQHSFSQFICNRYKHLDNALVNRIIDIVRLTYEFEYSFKELEARCIKAPLSIFKAQGDDYSFLENVSGYSRTTPKVFELKTDHYTLLKEKGIDELVTHLHGVYHQEVTTTTNAIKEKL